MQAPQWIEHGLLAVQSNFNGFHPLKSYGAEALGDIRVDLLPCVTPPNDPTVMSPQDPPTIMNISSSGNSKFCFLFFSSS